VDAFALIVNWFNSLSSTSQGIILAWAGIGIACVQLKTGIMGLVAAAKGAVLSGLASAKAGFMGLIGAFRVENFRVQAMYAISVLRPARFLFNCENNYKKSLTRLFTNCKIWALV
jgi:hypothetical protein